MNHSPISIDIHGHLGDILYPGGGGLIFRTGVPFPPSRGVSRLYENNLFRAEGPGHLLDTLFPLSIVRTERRRNRAATLENLRRSLDRSGVGLCVCAPIEPCNSFADIRRAAREEPRILPFTSPDFTQEGTADRLAEDLRQGARGVKIHPILQEVPCDGPQVMAAVEACAPFRRPVLLHAGASVYYLPREKRENLSCYASLDRVEALVAAFPQVPFLIGHGGLEEVGKVLDRIPRYPNAWVDTSFQCPEAIRCLVDALGEDRVCFASDWPYGLREPALRAVAEACGGNKALRRKLLYDNAAGLLRLGAQPE